MTRLRLHPIVLSCALAACGPEAETAADTGTGTDTSSDATTMAMTTTTATTTTTTTTTGMTGDTSTGEPPDDTTDGPADSTTTSDSGTTSQTETTTAGGDAAYPECMPDADPPCPRDFPMCAVIMMGNYSVCTIPCESEQDCPEPTSGDATVICAGPPDQQQRCTLACENATCPDGMDCIGVGPGGQFQICAWPMGN